MLLKCKHISAGVALACKHHVTDPPDKASRSSSTVTLASLSISVSEVFLPVQVRFCTPRASSMSASGTS